MSRRNTLWNKVIAIVLVMGLNLGIFDGVIRYAVQEWQLGAFDGFLQMAWAKSNKAAEKNKNVLPATGSSKEYKNPMLEVEKENNELVDKRTINSKTYKIGDDKYKTEVYQEPIHYVDQNSKLADIDNTLVESTDKAFGIENKANSIKVKFASEAKDQKLGKISYGQYSLEWSLLNSKEVKGYPARNVINYSGIQKNTDLRYTINGSALKEDIILNDIAGPKEFKFLINMHKVNFQTDDEGFVFVDRSIGKEIWKMPKAYMYDAKGVRSDNVKTNLEYDKGQLILKLEPDQAWLAEKDRAYPVVIDPTVVVQPNGTDGRDTFISRDYPSKNYRAKDYLYVGDTQTYGDTRSFYHFNLSTTSKRYVTSATFSTYAKEGSLDSVKLYPVTSNWYWNSDKLTWNYWGKNGTKGSLVDTSSGSTSGWWNFDNLKGLVQNWLDNPTKNYGLVLYPGDTSSYKEFYSCDSSGSSKWPKLVYVYTTTPPKPPTVTPPTIDPVVSDTTIEIITEPNIELVAPEFKLSVDKKTGLVKAEGTTVQNARVKLTDDEDRTFEGTADSLGVWKIKDMNFPKGKIKTLTMDYEVDVKVITKTTHVVTSGSVDIVSGSTTTLQTETTEATVTLRSPDSYSQEFLLANYSKGARIKRLAKFYYYDGTLADQLKEDNKITKEMDLVVGDYILVRDPLRDGPYTTGPINKDPDSQYRLREKLKPIYDNGEILGDSIDAGTGNFFDMETDLDYDGKGFPVEFTRTINSQQEEQYRGPLGLNWSLGYDRMIIKYEDGSLEVTNGDGGGNFYYPEGDGFRSDADVTDRLVHNSDGTYSLITEDNTVYHFDNDGMMDKITDQNGNSINLTYDPEGLLKYITDAGDRTSELFYDEEGQILTIVDPEGRQVDYNIEGNILKSVVDPDGGITSYGYNGLKVQSVTDPEGNITVTNTYDDQGRVKVQKDADNYYISLDYNGNSTILTDEIGNKFTYNYDNLYRITDVIGPNTGDVLPEQQDPALVQALKVKAQGTSKATKKLTITKKNIIRALASVSGGDIQLVQYGYDNLGNRTQVVDAMGNKTTYQYDSNSNLKTIIDSLGRETKYNYDRNQNLTNVTDTLNNNNHMAYDSRGNLLTMTNPLGETTTYTYDGSGQAKTVTDPAGKTVSYNYDIAGNVLDTTDGRGYVTQYQYDAIGRNKVVIDTKGNVISYEYDNNGNLLKENSPAGEVINSYDKNGNLLGTKDPEGNVTTYIYDNRGNMKEEIDPLLNTTVITYDGTGREKTIQDANLRTTTYEYDALGQLKKTIDPVGDVEEYYYDINGNRIGEKDANGQITKYEYDQLNRLQAVVDPLKQRTEHTYDALDNTRYYKDADGTVTEYKYDPLARVEEIIDAMGKTTKFTYDASGNERTVTNPLGQTYTYYYDANNNLSKVVDPEGKATEYTYDANNNQVAVKDALGNITQYEYDNQNRLISILDPLNHSQKFGLDNNGNRAWETDGNGHTTRYQYDAAGRLRFVNDAKGNATEYQYDKLGNLTKFIDAKNNVNQYIYNGKNLLTKNINPLGQATSYEYDKNSNITAKIDAKGQRIEYAYDPINRLLGTYYPDGKSVEYGYNQQGKREWMEDDYGTTWYDYDKQGHLTAVTNQDDMTTEYAYNDLGQKTKVKYPDGKEVKYDYDNQNRLKTVTDRLGKITAYDYDELGRRTKTTLPNGVVTTYNYDKANQLIGLASTNNKNTLLAKYQYQYDAAGNRTDLAETQDGTVYNTKYTYDPLNQLDQVTNPDGSQVKYQYDQVGNRTKMINQAGTNLSITNYNYNAANELTKYNVDGIGDTVFKYDSNGNRIAKIAPDNVVTNYSYDVENRLKEVQLHQGKYVSFEYDGDGNRITKVSGMKKPTYKPNPTNSKVKNQQAELIYGAMNNGNGNGNNGNNGNGNSGDNGNGNNGNGGDNGNGNNGNNGNDNGKGNNGDNGNDKDKDNGKPDKDKNGNGNDKDKNNNGNGNDKGKPNKDLTKEERSKKKDEAKKGQGYKQKGKYTNRGKHLGWYKNGMASGEQIEVTYYLNDVSDDLSQVLMTYNDDGVYDTAYTYGTERIGIDILDGSRPDAQNPLYYLYDGLGSVSYITKPDGEIRDTYKYDEFGKPNGKLSPDGDKILHTSFGYTGEQWDEESQLQYLRARYYDPEIGRFINRDTYEGEVENPLSKNLYAYVQNNPVNMIDPSGHVSKAISSFKKKHGKLLDEIAKEKSVNANTLAGVIIVESSGSGFSKGKLKIRFEVHYFLRLTKNKYKDYFSYKKGKAWLGHKFRVKIKVKDKVKWGPWRSYHSEGQKGEYAAFNFAKSLNEKAAYKSISMGMGQIMGTNYGTAGYKSAKAMFEDFSKGEPNQIRGMVNYISGSGLIKYLQKGDLKSFVKGYNGPGKVDDYVSEIKKAIEVYKKCKV